MANKKKFTYKGQLQATIDLLLNDPVLTIRLITFDVENDKVIAYVVFYEGENGILANERQIEFTIPADGNVSFAYIEAELKKKYVGLADVAVVKK